MKQMIPTSIRLTILALLVLSNAVSLRAGGLQMNNEAIVTLVEKLKSSLSITEDIRVVVVDVDARLVSVRPAGTNPNQFELRLERAFLAALSDEELEAVVAHELGHVWIYTHHPFLQTETLANRIATRAVSQEVLDRVYEKVDYYRQNQRPFDPPTVTQVAETVPAGLDD